MSAAGAVLRYERGRVFFIGDIAVDDRQAARITIAIGDAQFIGTSEIRLNVKLGTADVDAAIACADTMALWHA